MKSRACLNLFQYWNRLRQGGGVPTRAQIEPSDIRDELPQTMILESARRDKEMSFRLAGTGISAMFGRELRGTQLRDLLPDVNAALLGRLLRNCSEQHDVILLGVEAFTRKSRTLEIEILLLPLQDEAEGRRIFGAMAPLQTPFWLGVEAVETLRLQSIRVIDPEREPLFLANRPEVAVAPSLAPHDANIVPLARPEPAPRGAHLRLIRGGLDAPLKP